jgi:ABC-type sugar transport system substrate-binding protein
MDEIHARAGSTYTHFDSNGDMPTHMAQLEDSILQGVDAVYLHPMGTIELNPVCKKLSSAGIPICTYDSTVFESEGVPSPYITSHVGSDMVEIGRQDGQYVVDYLTQKGQQGIVFEVWGAPWHSVAQLRHQGFHEVVSQYPDIVTEVIESAPGDWTDAFSMSAVEDALVARPDINVIFEHSDVYSSGVIEALNVSDRLFTRDDPKHILFASVDGGDRAFGYISEGYMDCSAEVSSYTGPLTGWKLMFTWVCLGQPIATSYVDQPAILMTPDNVNIGLYKVIWDEKLGEYDGWPIYDYLVPMPTLLDPATIPPNPIPGREEYAPRPRLVTPDGPVN